MIHASVFLRKGAALAASSDEPKELLRGSVTAMRKPKDKDQSFQPVWATVVGIASVVMLLFLSRHMDCRLLSRFPGVQGVPPAALSGVDPASPSGSLVGVRAAAKVLLSAEPEDLGVEDEGPVAAASAPPSSPSEARANTTADEPVRTAPRPADEKPKSEWVPLQGKKFSEIGIGFGYKFADDPLIGRHSWRIGTPSEERAKSRALNKLSKEDFYASDLPEMQTDPGELKLRQQIIDFMEGGYRYEDWFAFIEGTAPVPPPHQHARGGLLDSLNDASGRWPGQESSAQKRARSRAQRARNAKARSTSKAR